MANTEAVQPAATKAAGWRRLVGVACGIGIVAVICLGIGLTFGVTLVLQIGIAVATVAAVVALVGGYDHFFSGG